MVALLLIVGSGCGVGDDAPPQDPMGAGEQELQYCTDSGSCGNGYTCAGNACRPTCKFDNPPVEALSSHDAKAFTGCSSGQYCCMGYYPTMTQPFCAPSPSNCLWGVYLYP
jgi:hypothetical protein